MMQAHDRNEELRFAIQILARHIRNSRGDELSDTQLAVLFRVERNPGVSPSELARWEHVRPPSMNRTLNALEVGGLVTRSPAPDDARRVAVHITDHARTVLSETRRLRAEWFSDRLASLTPEERAILEAAGPVLRKLAAE